jgi:hypothetical protein
MRGQKETEWARREVIVNPQREKLHPEVARVAIKEYLAESIAGSRSSFLTVSIPQSEGKAHLWFVAGRCAQRAFCSAVSALGCGF